MRKVICGIYCITCLSNKKSYLGSSYNIYGRWTEHKRDLRKNKHHSKKLQNSWNKYGSKNFVFSIVEEVEDENDLLKIEQKMLDKGKYYKEGLNCSPYAEEKKRWKHNKDKQKKRCIITWPDGHEEKIKGLTKFCAKNNLSQGAMNRISLHQLNIYKGFHCRNANETMEEWKKKRQEYIDSRPPKNMPSKKRQGGTWTIKLPNGKKVKTKSLTDFCKKHNLSQGNMSEIAFGKRNSHKGYSCSYSDD